MIRVGLIGYGYWGPNVARNFSEISSAKLAMICDLNPNQQDLAAKRHPQAKITADYANVLSDPIIDAVAIFTPLSSHFSLAMEALKSGKHVLVGKPLASSSEEAKKLIEEARLRGLTLMVDHTYLYSGAVRQIKKIIHSGELGKINYYDSVRINLGMFRNDADVLWDLASHDLAIMDYLFGKPRGVSATGAAHFGPIENTAYLTFFFEDDLIGHVHANWLAPVKTRMITIGGSKKMLVFDDLHAIEKIKVYDKGVTTSDERGAREIMGYRNGGFYSPQIQACEPLRNELEHFITSIETGEAPASGGEAGLRVVHLLEAASLSMKNRGAFIEFSRGFCEI